MAKSVRALFEEVKANPLAAWLSCVAVSSSNIEELPTVVSVEAGMAGNGGVLEAVDGTFVSLSDGPGQTVIGRRKDWINSTLSVVDDNTLMLQIGAIGDKNDTELAQDSLASTGLLSGLYGLDGNVILLQGRGFGSVISGMLFK